ncbi:MAG: TRAP transporter small permease subunit [Beijerinckiaceae bacterium]
MIDRIAALLSNSAMLLACIAVVLMMLHVTADAIGKYLLAAPVYATQETVQFYYMVALVFLPIAYIARGEGHICVELFTQNLRPSSRARLDVFVGVLTLIWLLMIAWYSAEEAIVTTRDGELQETSNAYLIVWPGRWFVPAGCAIMALAVVAQLIQDFGKAFGRPFAHSSETAAK